MKSGFGYFCFICASLLATYSFSQDPSGWSDKTVCRLASSQQDDPQYLQEANNRGLNCGSGVAKKTNNIRKSILSFSEIAAENKRFPKQPKDTHIMNHAISKSKTTFPNHDGKILQPKTMSAT